MNINIQALLFFAIAGLIGIVAHFAKKKRRGELSGNFASYMLADYPGRSCAMLAVFLGACLSAATTGLLNGIDVSQLMEMLQHGELHAPTFNALVSGFMLGWTLDSGINKGV